MYDRKFFRSRLGRAAILSILAMTAMNLVVAHGTSTVAVPAAAQAAAT